MGVTFGVTFITWPFALFRYAIKTARSDIQFPNIIYKLIFSCYVSFENWKDVTVLHIY